MMKTIIVQRGQTLWDIALQYCGTIDAAYQIAAINNILVTTQPKTNNTLKVPEVTNKKIVSYYFAHDINPASQI